MPNKIMKKQVSLPDRLTPAKQDFNGEKDTNPLLRNWKSVDTLDTKDQDCPKRKKKYTQPIHPIPSSMFVLNEEEKLELEAVLFDNLLISIGLL